MEGMTEPLEKGYTICQRSMPLNFKNLEQRLFEELNQLRKLEPGVELALRSLLKVFLREFKETEL